MSVIFYFDGVQKMTIDGSVTIEIPDKASITIDSSIGVVVLTAEQLARICQQSKEDFLKV